MSNKDHTGQRPRVVMLVANTIKSDGRVQKAASAVASFGYAVELFGVSPDSEQHSGRVGRAKLTLFPVSKTLRNAAQPTPFPVRVRKRASAVLGIPDEVTYQTKSGLIKIEQRELEALRGRLVNAREGGLRNTLRRARLSVKSRLIDTIHASSPETGLVEDVSWRAKIREMADYELAFGDAIVNSSPDVIHAHDVHLLGVAVRAAERLRARGSDVQVIYDSHEFVPGIASNQPWKIAAMADMEREYIGRVDRIVTVSSLLAEWLERDHRPTHPITVVMNTPAAAWDDATDAVPSLREQAGIPADAPMVLYSGGYSKFRGVHTLIDAMQYLPECHLALVASMPHAYVSQLLSRGEQLGVGERIHVAPFVPPHQVSRYLSEADVGVHPMLHAPNHEVALPNKYFEYLHAGLPIVVSDVQLMSQQTRLDGVGEVFPAENEVLLAEAISRVLADRKSYVDNITSDLLHEYSWERQAQHLRALYADLALSIPPKGGAIETSVRVEGVEYPSDEESVDPPRAVLIGPDLLSGQASRWAGLLAETEQFEADTAGFVSDGVGNDSDRPDLPMPRHRWNDETWQRVHVHRITTMYSHVLLTGATSLVGSLYGGLLGDEVAMLRTKGIDVAMVLDTRLVRNPALHRAREPQSPFHLASAEIIDEADHRSAQVRRVVDRVNAITFVPSLDLLDEVPHAAWLPSTVEPSSAECPPLDFDVARPLVVHAPLDRFWARSSRLDEIGNRMSEEGLIDYRSAHNLGRHELSALLRQASVVLDDFGSGHLSGVGLEALALGRIVVAYESANVIARRGEPAPVTNTTLDELEAELRSLVNDPAACVDRAQKGPEFIDRYHDGRLATTQLTRWVNGHAPLDAAALIATLS